MISIVRNIVYLAIMVLLTIMIIQSSLWNKSGDLSNITFKRTEYKQFQKTNVKASLVISNSQYKNLQSRY